MQVFEISELRKEILSYSTGVTLWPLRRLNRAFRDTIDELMVAMAQLDNVTHRLLPCNHEYAVKIGCIRCLYNSKNFKDNELNYYCKISNNKLISFCWSCLTHLMNVDNAVALIGVLVIIVHMVNFLALAVW